MPSDPRPEALGQRPPRRAGQPNGSDAATLIACASCPHGCRLAPGQTGICGAREGDVDSVIPQAYGRTTGLALDPIEKKPFARFMPGSYVLSTGSYGCNMSCPWCQNAHISTAREQDVAWRTIQPQELVNQALALQNRGCVGLAFTYNEPLICWEFVLDASRLARENGLVSTIVSNGMATDHVLDQVLPHLDGANIDLKCFDGPTYSRIGGSLPTVMNTISRIAACPTCHLEVTWLAVPGVSTDDDQLDRAAAWLAQLDPAIPLHVTRFFPCHRMASTPPTDRQKLFHLVQVARRHLEHVIPGNV